MKKVSLMIAALALVLGLSQCKKDEKPVASGEKQHIVLSASFGDSNSKIAEDGIGGLKWAEGDVINVFKGEQSLSEAGLTCTDPANGTFEGDITTATGDITFTFGEQKFDGQSGLLNDAISLSATTAYDPTGNYNVTMTMPHAVLKLDLSAFADDTKGAGVTVTITSGEVTLASVTGITANSKAVYVALPVVGTGSKKYTFNNGKGMNAEKTWPLEANTFYTKSGSTTGEAIVMPAYPVGAVNGLFTIDNYGTKVYFSKGNLQYIGSVATPYWKFADNQFVFLGNSGQGSTSETADRDLFGWGTSGFSHNHGYYQPWSTNTTNNKYYAYDMQYYGLYDGEGEMKGKADWGANAISNGGNQAGKWRTLTKDEWVYLISTRTVNGGQGEGKSYQRATVNSVYGMILYPDNYTEQASYASTDWATMEDAGCVFLPAAGYRGGTSVSRAGSNGCYWSSSCSSDNAYGLYFTGSNVNTDGDLRYVGYSVRLVSVK